MKFVGMSLLTDVIGGLHGELAEQMLCIDDQHEAGMRESDIV